MTSKGSSIIPIDGHPSSRAIKVASNHAAAIMVEHEHPRPSSHNDEGPLLGLELTTVEKSGQNSTMSEDSNLQAFGSPLLGTSYPQSVENVEGSSERRSLESVCYDKLLRKSAASSPEKSRKTASVDGLGCHGIGL